MNLKGLCGIFVVLLAIAAVAEGETWTAQAIGNVGIVGDTTILSSDSFSISGCGADISSSADAFQYYYQRLTGDGEVITRVVSVPSSNSWSKAGLMIRESLNANARNATVVVSRDNGSLFSMRKATGGSTSANLILPGTKAPQWLKLIRSGTSFSAYVSLDGVSWGLLGADNISMAITVYVGLAVTSHNNAVLGTASFDNVSIKTGTVADLNAPNPPRLVSGVRSNTSVVLSWSGAIDDVGICNYTVMRNGVAVATLQGTTSSYIDNGLIPSTRYVYAVTASDASGKVSSASNSATVVTDAAGAGVLGAWLDIGTVGQAGITSFDAGSSTYTIQGAGADISGTADACQFGYQPCTGDTEIVVRVGSIQNTNTWSKAGAMIRENLNANAAETSVFLSYSGGVVFQSRAAASGTTSSSASYSYASLVGRRAPQWVKLVRHGNDFKGYVSGEGVSWEYIGGATIPMAQSTFAGLAVSSHNTGALCRATFSNLSITSPVDAVAPSAPFGVNLYSLSDVSASLSWAPAGDDIAVTSYKVFQDGTYIGTTPFARFTDTFQDPGSSHSYTVQATDAAGNLSVLSDPLAVTLRTTALSEPWRHDDIGIVDWAGSVSLSSGTFGITAAGTDISGAQDSFHYIYQPLSGDKTIVARVASIPNAPNASVRAGVMIRETLDAGSRKAQFIVLSGSGASFQWRGTENGSSSGITGNATAKAPYWVKLVKGGNRFAGYHSPDGVTWTLAGLCTVPMGNSGYIGLALTSHDPRVFASAIFDSVQILSDSDNNGLADAWELTYFSKIGIDPNTSAPRNDGLSILQAFQQGLNPLDYYNGVAPKVTKVSGDNQNGAINTFLAQPMVIRVSGTDGNPLVNAPVTVTVPLGGGLVSASPASTAAASSVFHSDSNGLVSVYYQEGGSWGVKSQVKFASGKTAVTFAATELPQIGRWTFNSHTGITTPDGSSTGNTGSVIGGVTWDKGFDGYASVALDGSTGYLNVLPSPTMSLDSGPVSITAWIRLPKNLVLDNESKIYPIITLGDETNDGLSLCVRGGGHGLEASISTASGVIQVDGNGTMPVLTDGFWHQVGFIYDGNGNGSVVIDGTISATRSGIRMQPIASPRLWLGRDSGEHCFRGNIDEVELRRDALIASDLLARYNVDSNKDGLPDWWEWKYFGTLKVDLDADADGDGITNRQEYENSTSPNDYFNGIAPISVEITGNNQNGIPGIFLPEGLTVRVSDNAGNPLINAPVTFNVKAGGGFLTATSTDTKGTATLSLRTGANGLATAFYKMGPQLGISEIQVTTGLSSCLFTETAAQGDLATPWMQSDIGKVGCVGSGSLHSGTFGISGAGSGIMERQDFFHYVYQPLNGNGTIIARIVALPNPPNTTVDMGVMIRETLDPGARNAMLVVLGGSASGTRFQSRASALGSTSVIAGLPGVSAPYWVKLARAGSQFFGFQSADGVNWTLTGSGTVSMATSAFIGLAVSSQNTSIPAVVTFDSVQIVSDSSSVGIPDAWQLTYFKQLGVNPDAPAPCGNGLTIMQCYEQGLSPVDFYNGVVPTIKKLAGDGQNGTPDAFLSKALSVIINGTNGQPLPNAPVIVSVLSGGGLVSTDISGINRVTSLPLRTGTDGQVSFYYQESPAWGAKSTISVTAGKAYCNFAVTESPKVGYWTFNSHTGITTPDGSSTGNTGSVIGGVTWDKGFDGYASVALDGSTGYLNVLPSPTMSLGSGPVSITAWIRLPKNLVLDGESKIYPVVTLGDETSDGLSICVRGGGHGLETRINTASGVIQVDGNGTIPALTDGFWHHVGFIYDGNGNGSVVVDGTISATRSGIQMRPIASPRLWLGRDSAGHYFRGSIDEVELRRDALVASDLLARYNVDSNKDGLPDWWEWRYFGTLKVDLTAAQTFKNGAPPTDYFNGIVPVVTKVSGDNQNGVPGVFLSQSLTVKLSDPQGKPFTDAPVTFTIQSGGGLLTTSTKAIGTTTVSVRTGTDGRAFACYQEGSKFGVASSIQVIAGNNTSCSFSETASPLVAQWNLEDGNGLFAADSSNTGNSCALNGGASWITGYNGKGAVALDGSTGYLASAPSPTLALPGSNGAFSVTSWVRVLPSLSLDNENQIYPIITIGDAYADAVSLVIRGGGHGLEAVLDGTDLTVIGGAIDPSVIANGIWHLIGFSYDGKGNVIITFDGALLASKTKVTLPSVNSPRVWIGRDMVGNCFSGSIDDTRVRRDALTQNDFENLFISSMYSTAQVISGNAFASTSGRWMALGGSAVLDVDRRGSIVYNFSVPSTGIWAFQLAAQPAGNVSGVNAKIPVDILVDGVLLGQYSLNSSNGAVATISGLTQELQRGNHTIEVVNWNASGNRNLQINTIKILKPIGADQNKNGVADWVEQEVQNDNYVNPVPSISYTSPICIEGKARFPDQVIAANGTRTTGALAEVNGQWYANVPLNPDGTVTTIVSNFGGCKVSGTNTVTWEALNVVACNNTSMTIRKGDSLRLTGYPERRQPSGTVQLAVATGTNVIASDSIPAGNPMVYAFDQCGTYTVNATVDGIPTATVTVNVKEATFGDAIVGYVNNARIWTLPGIGTDLTVEWDKNLDVIEKTASATGRSYQVTPLISGTWYAVARLSAGGPILARGELQTSNTYSASATGDCTVISTGADGSQLVESSIVIDSLPPGGYAVVQIFIAGATFEDGTTKKVLTAPDFTNGVATFLINWANPHSVCHHVYIYDGSGTLVGAIN